MLEPIDMKTINLRKRLSDFRYLMRKIEDIIRQKNALKSNPSVAEVDIMYDIIENDLGLLMNSPSNRRRRVGQMGWRNAVKIIRTGQRNRNQQ